MSRFTQRARLLTLLLHRGSERLAIEDLADDAAEQGATDYVQVAEAALDGDEQAWRAALCMDLFRTHPTLAPVMLSFKTEVHVEVRPETGREVTDRKIDGILDTMLGPVR